MTSGVVNVVSTATRKADFSAVRRHGSAQRVPWLSKFQSGAAFVDMMRKTGSYTRQQLVGDSPALLNPPHIVAELEQAAQLLRSMPAPRIPRTIARPKAKHHLRGQQQHLAFVRQLPCVACGKAAPSEAAHVRTGTDGGVGAKPGNRYAVPLCTACHARQHRIGELSFWSARRIDPLNVALRLWTVSGDIKAGERTVFRARQQIDLSKA